MEMHIREEGREMRTTREAKESINFDPRIKLKGQLWKKKNDEVHNQALPTEEGENINLKFSYSQFLNKTEEHSSFDQQLDRSLIVFLYRRIGSKRHC
jgi:hypothetical protein